VTFGLLPRTFTTTPIGVRVRNGTTVASSVLSGGAEESWNARGTFNDIT
jgi:hypothetical protein